VGNDEKAFLDAIDGVFDEFEDVPPHMAMVDTNTLRRIHEKLGKTYTDEEWERFLDTLPPYQGEEPGDAES